MWNETSDSMTKHGIDERVPGMSARYYSDELTQKNYMKGPKGISPSRGSIATLRLLNVTNKESPNSPEYKILQELGAVGADKKINSVGMTSFLLQSIQYQDEEKSMVMQTFGEDSAVYFFGRSPRTMAFNGILFDDQMNNWFYKFMVAYDKLLRGTKVARNFRIVSMDLHNATVIGTIMNMSYSQEASNDNSIQFSFTLLVKRYVPKSARVGAASVKNEGINSTKNMLTTELPTLSIADIKKLSSSVPGAKYGLEGPALRTTKILPSFGDEFILFSGSPDTLGGEIRMSSNEFATRTIPYYPKKSLVLGISGESVQATSKELSAPSTYSKAVTKVKEWGSATRNFLSKIENGIRTITQWFTSANKLVTDKISGLVASIKSFLDPITKIVKATGDALTSIKTLVSTVQSSVDKVFEPLVSLSQDYNEMRRNLDSTIGMITNLPDTMSSKISNNIRLVRYGGMASLGSLSSGVSSTSARAVLSKINITSSTELGILSSGRRAPADESRVLAL